VRLKLLICSFLIAHFTFLIPPQLAAKTWSICYIPATGKITCVKKFGWKWSAIEKGLKPAHSGIKFAVIKKVFTTNSIAEKNLLNVPDQLRIRDGVLVGPDGKPATKPIPTPIPEPSVP
jgi:hypothetical protein